MDKIDALPRPLEFIIHTGELSHMSHPCEFDAGCGQICKRKTGTPIVQSLTYLKRFGSVTVLNGRWALGHRRAPTERLPGLCITNIAACEVADIRRWLALAAFLG